MVAALWLLLPAMATASIPRIISEGYQDYGALTRHLEVLSSTYPSKASLYSIGQSVEGRELWVLALAASQPDHHVKGRPEIKLVGNMHGDEAVGRSILLGLAEDILVNADSDPAISVLLNSSRIHILPSMNPDGFERSTEGTCYGSYGRDNSHGVDLNRNFPDRLRGQSEEVEPETRAVMEWSRRIPFVLSANLHGGVLVVNYPYDNSETGDARYAKTPEDQLFRSLALTYAEAHKTMKRGCRDETFAEGITNGAAWYNVNGGMQDWNYVNMGTLALTIELSCCKFPHASSLPGFWDVNRLPLLKFLARINSAGIRGIIRDPEGRPVRAELSFVDYGLPFMSTDEGEYWRILLPGKYRLQVRPERSDLAGWEDSFVISSGDGPPITKDILLSPASTSPHWPMKFFTSPPLTTEEDAKVAGADRSIPLSVLLHLMLWLIMNQLH